MRKLFCTLTILCLFLFTSCSDNEAIQIIPSTPVNFKININTIDNHLNSVGNIGVYIPLSKVTEYNTLMSGVGAAKIYSTPRSGGANERYGYSGVLIINTGVSTSGNASLAAYDLCCPKEQQQNTRVVPTNDLKAKCPKCNSVFDLFSGGRAIEGPATSNGKRLQPYQIVTSGEYEFRILH